MFNPPSNLQGSDDPASYVPADSDPPPIEPGSPVEVPEMVSHAGLTAVDPWSPPRRPLHQVLFPGGLGFAVEMLDVVVLALAMFLAVRFVAHNYVVDGGSMLPTFEDSDFLIVNRLAYRSFDFSWIPGVDEDDWRPFGSPQPGDVIVFAYATDPSERDFIKRVIAVPGQTVEIHDGFVYVDGEQLIEPYILEQPAYPPLPPEVVEPGKVFVLGDNRNNSYDSHLFGQVDQSTIIGRADFRYWPANRWGRIAHHLGGGDPEAVVAPQATSETVEATAAP